MIFKFLMHLLFFWHAIAIRVGVGKSDITGTIGEIDMMGYAKLGQQANGIHLRLYARAFIYGTGSNRVVYVSCNIGQISSFVKERVIDYLRNPLYTEENVMISAEHTHSGPSGFLDNFLYVANVFGVVPGEREPIAQGIVEAIQQAHRDFESSGDKQVTIHQGDVNFASINRSPSSYLENPAEERAKYRGPVDTQMTLLATRSNNELTSFVSWFPVHGVSMNETFKYVSGDNKGFAAHSWESSSKPGFIAAFSISNAGDVTPNISGPKCADTGAPCDGGKSSCPDKDGKPRISFCTSSGPAPNNDNFENTKIIGQRQADGARSILNTDGLVITDNTVQFKHLWVDMSSVTLQKAGKNVNTCKPAMGHSFSAGTTDGPGVDGSYQGLGIGNNGIAFLSEVLKYVLAPGEKIEEASEELKACQAPKSVLLATGEYKIPYPWQPSILPLQIFVIGRKLIIIGQPSEITTMAGRRLRESILSQMISDKTVDQDARVVIAGLSNHYASYVTTYEEYLAQRYEAGSTIYGPHTLDAFIKKFTELASSFVPNTAPLKNAVAVREGDYNEISLNNNLVHKVLFDAGDFGNLIDDVDVKEAKVGQLVSATFQCAHPRSHGTFNPYMAVEKLNGYKWETVLTDGFWDTKFLWYRTGGITSAKSECLISWSIGETVAVTPGTYRLRLMGTAVNLLGIKKQFQGITSDFKVVQ